MKPLCFVDVVARGSRAGASRPYQGSLRIVAAVPRTDLGQYCSCVTLLPCIAIYCRVLIRVRIGWYCVPLLLLCRNCVVFWDVCDLVGIDRLWLLLYTAMACIGAVCDIVVVHREHGFPKSISFFWFVSNARGEERCNASTCTYTAVREVPQAGRIPLNGTGYRGLGQQRL